MELKSWQWKQKCHGTISLCMIMKNEERWLARCLESVQGLADEIIIVDTGSTDRSVEIAKKYGAIVLYDKWQDDFARPRNIGIARATKEWILVMDPDETIAKRDHQKVRMLTNSGGVVTWQMDTRNYTNNRLMQGFMPNSGQYEEGKGWPGYTPSCKGRFFKHGLGFKFVGRWHEMVDYSVDRRKYKGAKTPIPIHHYAGEINQKSMEDRKAFYLRLGEMKVKDNPKDIQAWWELGIAEGISGYFARSARSFIKSMETGYYTSSRMFQLASVLKHSGQPKTSNFAFEKAICKLYPNLTHYEDKLKNLSALFPHLAKK